MPASVNFKGNDGNQMFQYITAVVFCVKYNIELQTRPTEKLLKFFTFSENIFSIKKQNEEGEKKKLKLTFRNFDKNDELQFKGHNYHYIFTDYFQNSVFLNNNYNIIKENVFLIRHDCRSYLSNYKQIQENDILFIMRLGDFKHEGENSEIVHPNYFLNILENNNFSNIYISIHPFNDKSQFKYLNFLNKYKEQIIILEDRSELIAFNIVNHFKNIAIPNSTFNWWSIFFQEELNNKKIFTPKFTGYFGIGDKFKCHGGHIKNLCNIRNISIPVDNEFIDLG